MGGAINLLSRKPTSRLEGDVLLGVSSGFTQGRVLRGSNPGTPLTDTPTQKLFAHAGIALGERWEILATLDAESGRLVSFSGPSKVRELGSFASFGTTVAWHPRDDLTVEAGVRNLGDKWYELADGYPMPGRNWCVNTRWRF